MKLTSSSLKVIVTELNEKISHNHIGNITVINSHDIFMTFSMYRKEKLLISLNPNNPFVCLCNIDSPVGTKIGNLNDSLRKEIKDGYILGIGILNDDRVLFINYGKTNDYYEKEKKTIIIELIPHRPNLIIVDDKSKIIFASHYTDALNEHPVLKGAAYQPLKNKNSFEENVSFNLDEFKKESERYYQEALRKRLEEQFKPVLQHIKSRIKTLKKKIEILSKEIETAKENLDYQNVGQMILTYADSKEDLRQYIEENDYDYDWSKTPGTNANKYFNKYKKAKRTLEIDKQELLKTDDEIDYLQSCLAQSKYMNEEDIIELANLLFPKKFKLPAKRKNESKLGEITVEGVKIMYGKNAQQNELLTFKKAQKDYLFFHIKDAHGSHVVIMDSNPSKQAILTACEIALLLSQKPCGDVQSTKIKNIKKGSFVGQAILTSYETYTINSIRENTEDLLKF